MNIDYSPFNKVELILKVDYSGKLNFRFFLLQNTLFSFILVYGVINEQRYQQFIESCADK